MAGLLRSLAALMAVLVVWKIRLALSVGVVSSAPSPPTNVMFTTSSNERGAPVITATWSEEDRCDEPCGYVVTCCIPKAMVEINTTVWESDLGDSGPIRVNVTGVNPATGYVCKVAAFNAYGVGSTGSNLFVEIPATVPRTAPTEVYASDINTDSFRVNWRYSETPPPGNVSSFKIELYYKDNRYPGRHGEQVRDMTFALSNTDRQSLTFSNLLMYLDPGTEYNILIRAVTSKGAGPAARIGQKTMSTVPMLVPRDVTGSIISFVSSEPPAFSLSWSVRDRDRHLTHDIAGFLISCSANHTSSPAYPITISEPVFTAGRNAHSPSHFSGVVYFPNTCGSGVSEEIGCSVAAFNSEGEGERSDSVLLTLPCSSERLGLLESSFLSDPHSSLALVLALLLLLLCLVGVAILLCVCPPCPCHQSKKKISDSTSIDGNYVPMASTEVGIKSQWSVEQHSEVDGPGSRSVGVVLMERGDPPYDEIAADRQDNLYDEIHPRTSPPGSAHQPGPAHQSGSSLDRPCTGRPSHAHSHLQTQSSDSDTGPGHQSIPLPSSSHTTGSRDSTLTQYMELSSPLVGGGGVVTDGNGTRYSAADSGVNVTSPDMERSLKLGPHSNLPRNGDVEHVQFRHYPYFVTEIPVSVDENPDTSYYNIMVPLSSVLPADKDEVERNGDTQLTGAEMDAESGVGMESQVSDGSTTRLCSIPNVESGPEAVKGTTAVSLVPTMEKSSGRRRRAWEKWSGVGRESICEGGEEGEEEEEGEMESEGEEMGSEGEGEEGENEDESGCEDDLQ